MAAHIVELADGQLWARIYLAPNGRSWYMHYRLPGRESRMKLLGPSPSDVDSAKAAARRFLEEHRYLVVNADVPTLRTAAEAWLEHKRPAAGFGLPGHRKRPGEVAPDTWTRYRGIINNHLLAQLGELTFLDKVTEDDVEGFCDYLAEATPSASSINQAGVVLSGIYSRARRRPLRYRGPDPTGVFETYPIDPYGPYEHFTLEELEALVAHAVTEDDADLYVISGQAGLRRGESRGLRWGTVDLTGRRIVVDRAYTDLAGFKAPKGGRPRGIDMTEDIHRRLVARKLRMSNTAADDLVFPGFFDTNGEVKPMGATLIHKHFVETRRAAGVRPLVFHCLRHTFCTWAAVKFPLAEVQRMAGHSTSKMTERYVHHVPDPEAAARLTEAFRLAS